MTPHLSHTRIRVPIVSVVERRTKGRMMSLAAYMDWKPDDGFTYEWNNGVLEQCGTTMTQAEAHIFYNLQDKLAETASGQMGGRFIGEVKIFTGPQQVRIPDISYITREQARVAFQSGQNITPDFVIELISETDTVRRVEKKLQEYFQAGVRVVWHVQTATRLVEVYTSPKQVVRCSDTDLCSAAPAIPDFALSVQEIFGV